MRTFVWFMYFVLSSINAAAGVLSLLTVTYVRDDVHPVVGDSLRKPIDALQYYLVLVVVTLALYHVISLFTLLYKLARKNGVSPWYGYVLGGTFYMAFIMLGAGFFVGGFHPNLKAIHDSRVGLNQDGFTGRRTRTGARRWKVCRSRARACSSRCSSFCCSGEILSVETRRRHRRNRRRRRRRRRRR